MDPTEVLHQVGTLARVIQAMPIWSQKSGDIVGLQMLVYGSQLVRIEKVLKNGPPLQAEISQVKAEDWDDKDETLKATMMETIQTIKEPRQKRYKMAKIMI